MSVCTKCGKEIKGQAKYCKACGGALSKTNASLSEKKARVTGSEKTWVRPALVTAAVVIVVLGIVLFKNYRAGGMGSPAFSPHRDASARLAHAVTVTVQGSEVRIPLETAADGKAHFFAFGSGGKTITFFVMKDAAGGIRSAFDACTACNRAKLGYRQEGGLVACNNCGMGFSPTDIGKITGGCNPIPLPMTVENNVLVFKARDLESGAQYF